MPRKILSKLPRIDEEMTPAGSEIEEEIILADSKTEDEITPAGSETEDEITLAGSETEDEKSDSVAQKTSSSTIKMMAFSSYLLATTSIGTIAYYLSNISTSNLNENTNTTNLTATNVNATYSNNAQINEILLPLSLSTCFGSVLSSFAWNLLHGHKKDRENKLQTEEKINKISATLVEKISEIKEIKEISEIKENHQQPEEKIDIYDLKKAEMSKMDPERFRQSFITLPGNFSQKHKEDILRAFLEKQNDNDKNRPTFEQNPEKQEISVTTTLTTPSSQPRRDSVGGILQDRKTHLNSK